MTRQQSPCALVWPERSDVDEEPLEVLALPNISGGASTTVGPSARRSRNPIPYTVSVFPNVRASISDFQTMNCCGVTAPNSRNPRLVSIVHDPRDLVGTSIARLNTNWSNSRTRPPSSDSRSRTRSHRKPLTRPPCRSTHADRHQSLCTDPFLRHARAVPLCPSRDTGRESSASPQLLVGVGGPPSPSSPSRRLSTWW